MVLPTATADTLAPIAQNAHLGPLYAEDRWLCWEGRAEEGKPHKASKRPVNARTGGDGRSNDPDTWSTFEQAHDMAIRLPSVSGIGISLLGSEFVGLDLDHVIDMQTGEVNPQAAAFLAALPETYVERSPSGDGFRVFMRGALPEGTRHQHEDAFGPGTALECYDGKTGARYLTVTGNTWTDAPIAECDPDAFAAAMQYVEQPADAPARTGSSSATRRTVARSTFNDADPDAEDLDRARYCVEHVLPGPDDNGRAYWLARIMELASLGEPGRELAQQWSARGPKFNPKTDCTDRQFEGFDGSKTVASLFAECDRLDPNWRSEWRRGQMRIVDAQHHAAGEAFCNAVVAEHDARAELLRKRSVLPEIVMQGDGPIMDYARAVELAARRPSIELALAASVTAYAGVVQQFLEPPGGGMVGQYCVGVASSGGGKDSALQAVTAPLSSHPELVQLLGPQPKSGPGLRDSFQVQPSQVTPYDEIGKELSASLDSHAGEHKKSIVRELLERFTSRHVIERRGAADIAEQVRTGANSKKPVTNATLSVFGVTTPETLFEKVGAMSITDGLFGRVLFVESPFRRKAKARDRVRRPEACEEFARALLDGRMRAAPVRLGELPDTPLGNGLREAHFADDAEELAQQIDDEIEDRLEAMAEQSLERPLLARLHEKIMRVATVYGWSRGMGGDGEEPIDVASVRWAEAFVRWSHDCTLRLLSVHVAELGVQPDDVRALEWWRKNHNDTDTMKPRDFQRGPWRGIKADTVRAMLGGSPLFAGCGDDTWRRAT